MQGDEFFSTWVANKAIYRTRMALADGGELVVIAPGLKRFGEQPEVDALIRKYGYCGTPKAMAAYRSDPQLQDLAHAAAHLIHGSSEGRFTITYAPAGLSRQEIEGVGFALRRPGRDAGQVPERPHEAGVERHARRRASVLHSHALGRIVGHSRETLRPHGRLRGVAINT